MYTNILYTFIYLYLINIKLLIRPGIIKLYFNILTTTLILLLTDYIAALTYLESTYLQIYLIVLTFNFNISGRYKVVVIYTAFYKV